MTLKEFLEPIDYKEKTIIVVRYETTKGIEEELLKKWQDEQKVIDYLNCEIDCIKLETVNDDSNRCCLDAIVVYI